ncbi:class I SAM-dependent methyltransferase [Patescibacteria group bacterium]|nr:class I SAM-dependent methyltransferase [Patescibacteria group bacterium]
MILISKPERDYELLDSGQGEKLERYGDVILSRPDPQALWGKRNPELWKKAKAVFKTNWAPSVLSPWQIELSGLKFVIKLAAFKHTGVFPEQIPNWKWIEERKAEAVLNLFGYTGGATLAAAKSGAKVVHVDSSKTAIAWARENASASGLAEKPVRWILDDALAFVKREIKRGNKYDGIVLDPPAFGRGAKGEVWKIERDLPKLLELCFQLLSDNPSFFLLNGYATGYSAIGYQNCIESQASKGVVESGELAIQEASGRLLPAGIFSRLVF